MNPYQHTIKKEITCTGIGLHSGKPVTLTISPAAADSGINFRRSDVNGKCTIPAFMDRVVDTRLATTIGEADVTVATTEHLLAALSGLGIDNATIELDTAEVPIMDGSAGPFVQLLNKSGRKQQKSLRKLIRVTDDISYQNGDGSIRIHPYDGLRITALIDFDHHLIKKQAYTIEMTPEIFAREIADARTFGFKKDVELLRKNGLALGGSLENAVVVDSNGVLNKDGLRFADEFVRHKILDVIGDLALLGFPLLGHVIAYKSGHGQHLELMREIAARTDAWELVTLKKSSTTFESKIVSMKKAAGEGFIPLLLSHPATFADNSCAA